MGQRAELGLAQWDRGQNYDLPLGQRAELGLTIGTEGRIRSCLRGLRAELGLTIGTEGRIRSCLMGQRAELGLTPMGPVVLSLACVFSALKIRRCQDQSFDNPAAVCLALWARNWVWLMGCVGTGVWADAPSRFFMKGAGLVFLI